jgi:hypothetical protein
MIACDLAFCSFGAYGHSWERAHTNACALVLSITSVMTYDIQLSDELNVNLLDIILESLIQ